MKQKFTITIPARIATALEAEATRRGFGEDIPELVRNGLMLACQSPEGWTLRLPLPATEPDPRQAELPLESPTPGA